MIKSILKYFALFCMGGFIYYCIELLWRGFSHPSMYIVGGLCFVFIGLINNELKWNQPLYLQMLIATIIILILELIAGCIVNLWLGWNVWDYSQLPFNILGQITLQFAGLWYLLSVVGIVLDDYIRYYAFNEEKPRYSLFKKVS